MLAAPTVAANATTAAKTIPNTNITIPFLYFNFNIILFLTIFQCYPIFNLYLISNTSLILKSIINLFRILTFPIFIPYYQYLSYPEITNLLSFFLNSDAKIQLSVFEHKLFRRKVSKSTDFLIKVKNLYRDVTKRRPHTQRFTAYGSLLSAQTPFTLLYIRVKPFTSLTLPFQAFHNGHTWR